VSWQFAFGARITKNATTVSGTSDVEQVGLELSLAAVLCGLLTTECAWSDHTTSSVTAAMPPINFGN